MSWEPSSVELLRVLINDVEETPTYNDDRLIRALIVAGYQVLRVVDFSQNFVVDIQEQTITPDPTDTENQTNDEDFINLMCLKAACIMDMGAARQAAGGAFAGKDLVSAFDFKGVATSTLALIEKGWCAVFDESLDNYLDSNGVLSAAVMSPFRTRGRLGYYPYYSWYGRGGTF